MTDTKTGRGKEGKILQYADLFKFLKPFGDFEPQGFGTEALLCWFQMACLFTFICFYPCLYYSFVLVTGHLYQWNLKDKRNSIVMSHIRKNSDSELTY